MSGRHLALSLAVVFSVVFVLVLALIAGTAIPAAYAADPASNSSYTEGELDGSGYTEDEAIASGASFTVDETVTETRSGGAESTALMAFTSSTRITLTGDMLAAVRSGRLSASLVADGNLDLAVPDGNFGYAEYAISVSGALTGSVSSVYTAEDFPVTVINPDSPEEEQIEYPFRSETFAAKELAPLSALGYDGESSVIKIQLTVRLRAVNQNPLGSGVSTATVTAKGSLQFSLDTVFEKVAYKVAANGNGTVDVEGTTVGSDESLSGEYGFGSAIAFEAVPNEGYYFANWTGTTATSRLVDLGKAVEIPSGTVYNLTANFSPIGVDQGSVAEFVYTGLQQGPRVTNPAIVNVYFVEHSYKGTGDTVYSDSQLPKSAGSYIYEFTVYRRNADGSRGEQIGHVKREFSVTKAPLAVSVNAEQTLSYGYTASGLDFSNVTVSGVPGESPTYSAVLLNADRTPAVTDEILPVGIAKYIYRITPTDVYTANYAYVDTAVAVTVEDNVVTTGTALDESAGRTVTVKKTVVTAFASDGIVDNSAEISHNEGEELIKIKLHAEPGNDTERFFFIGWRVGMYDSASDGYIYKYYTAGKITRDDEWNFLSAEGLDLVYYIPSAYNLTSADEIYKYTHVRFEAVFVEDTTADASTGAITKAFTGRAQLNEPSFAVSTAVYGFGPGTVTYWEFGSESAAVATAPTAIGTHTMVYTVSNNQTGTVVDTRRIPYVITVAGIQSSLNETASVGQGSYSVSTGWARKMFYNLNVSGLISSGVEKYYYSTDGGLNWTEVSGDIASNNQLTFATPDMAEGAAAVISYMFMAVNGVYGVDNVVPGYKVIAISSGNAQTAKLDNTAPEILSVDYAPGYSADWTNADVKFTATVKVGASGAILRYTADGGLTYTQIAGVLGYNSGTETKTREETVTFSVNPKYLNADLVFEIRNAVGLNNAFQRAYHVSIDTVPPVLEVSSPDTNVNKYGWRDRATTFTLRATEQGGSGVAKVYEQDGKLDVKTAVEGSTYRIVIDDNAYYTLVIRDVAGNTNTLTVQYDIDVAPIEYEIADVSYQAGEWTNADATVVFNVTAGGSGLRMSYSADGGEFVYCDGAEFGLPEGAAPGETSYSHVLSYTIPASDAITNYVFRIENEAERIADIDFGEVRFDTVKPVVTLLTDLGAYQSGWFAEAVKAEFTVTDGGGSLLREVVSDNGGTVVYDEASSRYSVMLDKCTPFTVSAYDNAGNVAELVLQVNVDTVTPELTIAAYIGGGDPEDISVEPVGEYTPYDFTSWITAALEEPWIRIEFTINLTASGSTLQYSTNKGSTWIDLTETYMPEGGAVSGIVSTRTYITTEQNREYIFRLVTGSGAEVVYKPLGEDRAAYVRIDFTAPVLTSDRFSVAGNSDFPLKTEWTDRTAQWFMSAEDYSSSGTGSGVKESSLRLTEYDASVSDEDILSGVAEGVVRELVKQGQFYTYTFTAYNKFLLTFEDNAGNAYQGEIFTPLIDATGGFTATVTAEIYSGGASAGEYVSGTWLEAGQSVRFTAVAEGIEGFGPSGAKLEISVDGGKTWNDTSAAAEGLAFVYGTAESDQYRVYRFRIITGAGIYAEAAGEFAVYKDNTVPEVLASVAYAEGGAYSGEWTAEALEVTVTVTAGAAGGRLYVGEASEEALVLTVPSNAPRTYEFVYAVEASVGGELTFVYVSNKPFGDGYVEASASAEVYYDGDPVAVEVINEASGAPSGSWTHGVAVLEPEIVCGISGIYEVYFAAMGEDGEWGEYQIIEAPYSIEASAPDGETTFTGVMRFKVVNGAGAEAVSEPFELKIDNTEPSVSVKINGTPIGTGTYRDWYLNDVSVDFTTTSGASGVTVEYSYRINGSSEWSDWVTVSGNSVTLTDDSVSGEKGGSDRYYRFRAVSGAGVEVFAGEGGTFAEYYIPIDLNYYTLDVVTTVGGMTDEELTVVFASVNGENDRLRRGTTVTLTVTPNTGYYFKSFSSDADDFSASYTAAEKWSQPISNNYTVGGSDINVAAAFYKEIAVAYSNLTQTLQTQQDNRIVAVACIPQEADFVKNFGDPEFVVEYDGSTTLPSAMGAYAVTVTTAGAYTEDYFVANPEALLTIVYFAGAGTSASPYYVRNEQDLRYIDTYMYYVDSYATEGDAYAFLGENRRTAYFMQSGDILLSPTFVPLATSGDGYDRSFRGTYNGNGYTVSYASTYAIDKSFALFGRIEAGAVIINLGVSLNLRNNVRLTDAVIGYIASEAVDSGINACFVTGEVDLTGDNIVFGGIVGKATDTLVARCFSDVKINVSRSSGYVGGIVGNLAGDAYVANSYTVSGIAVTGSARYSSAPEAGTQFLYAGAVTGYADGLPAALPAQGDETYYLDKNLSYDGSIESGLALGNAATFDGEEELRYTGNVIDFFVESTVTLVSSSASSITITVGELAARRIDSVKAAYRLTGSGTSESPFLIDTETKFSVIEIFPWASYKQTADITLTERGNYASAIPFVGVYDGDGHAICGARFESDTANYGGLFAVLGGTVRNLVIRDAAFTYTAGGALSAGAVAGIAAQGAVIEKVTVTGTINIYSETESVVYAGGLVGYASGAVVTDSVSVISLNVTASRAVAGGMIGQAEGASSLGYLVSMTALTVNYDKQADVGGVIGAVKSLGVTRTAALTYLSGSAYAYGKEVKRGIGYDATGAMTASGKSYANVTTETDLVSGGITVGARIDGLSPFEGSGTSTSPYIIDSYQDLLMVGNYMYASFRLGADIVIGDLNNDGKLDASDGYKYDYAPIGNGAAFTGSFDGKYHSVVGLTDSLFAVNAGTVRDVTLTVNYKMYAYADDIPASDKILASDGEVYTAAKTAEENADLEFGAVARVNTATGKILRVSVAGEISVALRGTGKAVIGGFVGRDLGGQITASDMSASVKVRALSAEVGGAVGVCEDVYGLIDSDNYIGIAAGLDVGGVTVRAGIYIGAIKAEYDETPTFSVTNTTVKINGVNKGNTLYVGYDING